LALKLCDLGLIAAQRHTIGQLQLADRVTLGSDQAEVTEL